VRESGLVGGVIKCEVCWTFVAFDCYLLSGWRLFQNACYRRLKSRRLSCSRKSAGQPACEAEADVNVFSNTFVSFLDFNCIQYSRSFFAQTRVDSVDRKGATKSLKIIHDFYYSRARETFLASISAERISIPVLQKFVWWLEEFSCRFAFKQRARILRSSLLYQ
jgi:hypothetical protein